MKFLTPLRSQKLSGDLEKASKLDDEEQFSNPQKKPSMEALKRKATLVLNSSRRFRYLKRQEQLPSVSRFRINTQALRAVQKFKNSEFKDAGSKVDHPPPEGFAVGAEQLVRLVQGRDHEGLQTIGGVGDVAKGLNTNLEKGIDPESVQRRKEAFGVNSYPSKPGRSFLIFLWEAAHDTTLIILAICAIASLVTEMSSDVKKACYDGASIAFAVGIVIFVTAYSDYRQSLQFRSLNHEKRNIQIQVIRGGRRFPTSIYDLVVGDIVFLNIGDQVPADGILVSGHSLSIDESSLTGGSEPVYVEPKHPFFQSGCKIVDGYGTMLVTAVGMNTNWGRVMSTLDDDSMKETPLQVRLNGFATYIGIVGLGVALIVLIMLLLRYFIKDFRVEGVDRSAKAVSRRVVDIISIAVAIVVVAVPEGLPLAVTLTLAYSMKKMMADKALVRHLSACETMGSVTTICCDKTGTLTLNEMTAVKAWVAGKLMESDAVKVEGELHEIICEGVAQNSTGSVFVPNDGGEREVTGSPTEKAILQFGFKLGMDFERLKAANKVLHVETFNSTKKRAGVAVKRENGNAYVHWKGATEIIVELCTKYMNADGSESPLDDEKKVEIDNVVREMASLSLRCIALAYRPVANEEVPSDEELEKWVIPEKELVLLAIVGIEDPCRTGVDNDVQHLCQKAGVKVRMVTGDHPITAQAIAQKCNILTSRGLVIEGKDFRSYTHEQRLDMLPTMDVMARASPMDKLLLVQTLRSMQQVVAVTGDDARALYEADIGLSMGIQGTQVAKESSDIIILDDNFASVVKVVRWGRSVYANIQKFIQFQLTVNFVALTINLVAAVRIVLRKEVSRDGNGTDDLPLTAVQLLWVNLIMDTLGALALATEPPTDDLLDRPPVGLKEPLVTNIMQRNIFIQVGYQVLVLLILYFKGDKIKPLKIHGNEKLKNTIIFNAFVLCQLFNLVNSRTLEKLNVFWIFRNPLFCELLSVTALLQVIIVTFLGKFFRTTRLNWSYWLFCIVIGASSLIIGFVGKFIPVPRNTSYLVLCFFAGLSLYSIYRLN